MRVVGGLLAVTAILTLGPTASAAVQVSNRVALGGNLTIPWTSFGPVGSTLNVYQQQTVGPELVHINSSSGTLFIKQQGSGFNGNFPSSTVVLTQPNPDDGVTIGFVPSVLGLGFDIGPVGFSGAYTAYLQTFDSAANSIGIIAATGTATTPAFLGETSFDKPIAFFVVGLVEPGNTAQSQMTLSNDVPVLGNAAIDALSVILPVPEPPAISLMLAGVILLAWRRFQQSW